MALEIEIVILMARMTKLKRITRNIYTTREDETGHVSCLCPAFFSM